MKRLFILLAVALPVFLTSWAQAQNEAPGKIIIHVQQEYLPLQVVADSSGNIITGLSSVDSLNVLWSCQSFRKVSKYDWEPIGRMYLLTFPDSLDVHQLASGYLQTPFVDRANPV